MAVRAGGYNRAVRVPGIDEPRRPPRAVLRGALRPPGSKSIALRALVGAGLASGRTRIAGLSRAADVLAAVRLLEGVRCGVERLAPSALAIAGRPPGPGRGWRPKGPLALGESGTLARFATAAIGLCGEAGARLRLEASGTLLGRESGALLRALERAGVGISHPPGARALGWPVELVPIGPPPELWLEAPGSSQEASALLFALAAWPGESLLHVVGALPSRPYLELSLDALARFGARIEREPRAGQERFLVRGPLAEPADPIEVEPDASAAAVALAAACLSGGELEVLGLSRSSRQGDLAIVEQLVAFGCQAERRERSLFARGRPTHGAELDLGATPDLAPVAAALAAASAREGASSLLRGLATLEGKESPRKSVLAGALGALGFAIESGPDFLAIGPGRRPASGPLVLDPRSDHRMAFAFALLAIAGEEVLVADPGCVAKSWPSFWRDLERLAS